MLMFECPSCQTKLPAAEKHADGLRCPQCQRMMSNSPVPTGSAAPGARSARSSRDDDDDDRPRGGRSASGDAAKAAGVGLGAGAMVLIILGVSGCCVLGVGAVAVALIVPATQKVREAAARTQSTNNLKNIGLAFHGFHDVHKHLPFNGNQPAQRGNHSTGSWAFQILPFVDQQPMFNSVNRSAPVLTYLCPGRGRPHLESTNGGGAWSDYFYNNYLNDSRNASNPGTQNMKRSMVGIADGTSNTIFVGHGNIAVPQYTSSANVTLSTNIFIGGTTGTMRAGNNGENNPTGVFLQRDSTIPPGIGNWGGPFPQGSLMCMGDATIRIFPYSFANLGPFLTPTGGEPAVPPDF